MRTLPVELPGREYKIEIGAGNLRDSLLSAIRQFDPERVVTVTNSTLEQFYPAQIKKLLEPEGYQNETCILPDGEEYKNLETLQRIYDFLMEKKANRGTVMVAFGGGVIGDMAGFAAATFMRGIKMIQVPTTLLAQVDSSVGGKTAINSAAGKNLIGAFHQPSLVLADLATLDTLPDREMRAGYAEVLKYGVLGDAEFFAWLEDNGSAVLARDPAALEQAVATSVSAKARIVAEDERETTGARALLNLGHTFGHALEAETGFSDRLLHGEAVALGMILAARYSARRGLLSEDAAQRLTRAADAAGLPSEIAALGIACSGRDLADHMLHDKKMDAGTLPFLLLRSIGAAFLTKDVALDDVALFLDEELQAH